MKILSREKWIQCVDAQKKKKLHFIRKMTMRIQNVHWVNFYSKKVIYTPLNVSIAKNQCLDISFNITTRKVSLNYNFKLLINCLELTKRLTRGRNKYLSEENVKYAKLRS
jgi:hypothetical protein